MQRCVAIIALAAFGLSGCTSLGVLTFDKHEKSGFKDGRSFIVVQTLASGECSYTSKVGEDPADVSPFVGETAVATAVVNLVVQELRTRADRMAARFTSSYGGRATYRIGSTSQTNCVTLYRVAEVGDREIIVTDAMFEVRPVPGDGVPALQVVPVGMQIGHAAAVTSEASKEVRVVATVVVAGVAPTDKGPQAQAWLTQTFNIGPVKVGGEPVRNPDFPSSVFVAAPQTSAVTIAIAITETGQGADHYTSASAALEANRAAATTLVSDILKRDDD